MSTDEHCALEQLTTLHPEIHTAFAHFDSFASLIRERSDSATPPPARRLEQWMAAATASGVGELTAFVTKLRQDAEAVVAALTLPYSQGQIAKAKRKAR
jgi:transposase